MQTLLCDYDSVDWDGLSSDPNILIFGDSSKFMITQEYVSKLFETMDNIESITLKDIQYVANYAFSNMQKFQFELILSNESTCDIELDNYAFFNSGLSGDVILSARVKKLGLGVFKECQHLESVVFPVGNTYITAIPDYFCDGCRSLTNIGTISGEIIENNKFTDHITVIGEYAFRNCALSGTLTISDYVTNIGNYAFYNNHLTTINLGSGIVSGATMQNDAYQDSGYTTERTLTTPYKVFLTSKRQFRYKHLDITVRQDVGYLLKFDDGDPFRYCIKSSHIMIFKNGLLLPNTYYYVHSIVATPMNEVGIIFNVPLAVGDTVDIFYVTNDMHHLETDYYDTVNRKRYIENGLIMVNPSGNEYRVMGEQMYSSRTDRTNYIKMHSPLYGISSKHSCLVFLNGKKVRMDELEDISDTIMSINTDYASYNPDNMNAVRLEVLCHLDESDVIEYMYINDGISHGVNTYNGSFLSTVTPRFYENTNTLNNLQLSTIEAFAGRCKLDEMLNDLSNKNLNKLFYDYQHGTGPMTPYGELSEPDWATPDEVLPVIIDEYYYDETQDYVWDVVPGEYANTIFYIGSKDRIRVPTTYNEEAVKSLYGTTYNRNTFLKKIVIPEGVESIE